MSTDKLKNTIEAILFISGEPVGASELSKILETTEEEIMEALTNLQEDYARRGLIITQSHGTFQLVTSPEVSAGVKKYLQAELREKLTEAAVETLSIIAYKQPVSRSEIEAIRGVNCQYVLRLLSQRGLIEKTTSAKDARVVLYQTTHEFLHQLGINDVKALPDFEVITAHLKTVEAGE